MTDEEKKKFFEISKRIGYKVGTYCNDEEVEVFEKLLKDYKYKNNLIEKQQRIIEEQKSRCSHLGRDVQKAVDYTFELNKEIEKKDKIIDEMAEHIVSSAIVDDTVCAIKCDCDNGVECSHKKMLKCTKEYFKKKVEDK